MKKFLIYIAKLLLSILLILIFLDYCYTWIYTKGFPRNKISYLLTLENAEINYVFIGSSRVENTIDTEVIEKITGKKVLNLGVQGAEMNDYLLMLQLIKNQQINTDTIFIQIDYVYNLKGNSEILKSSLMPFIHKNFVSDILKNRYQDFWKLKYIPFYRYLRYDYKLGFREFISTAINKKPLIELENGYLPKYGQGGSNMQMTLPEKLGAENQDFLAIEKFAEENDIKIVYFTAPYCSGTINKDYGEKLKTRIPSLFNYSTIFIERDYLFFNCNHLNDQGAKEFSKIIAKRILNNKVEE